MYKVNFPRVVHETLDNETVIIDTMSGYYYTARDEGSIVWNALAEDYTPGQVRNGYCSIGMVLPDDALNDFIQKLSEAELLVVSNNPKIDRVWTAPECVIGTGAALMLERHDDMKDLIELDPIHEIDARMGWPFQASDTEQRS